MVVTLVLFLALQQLDHSFANAHIYSGLAAIMLITAYAESHGVCVDRRDIAIEIRILTRVSIYRELNVEDINARQCFL